MAKVSITPSCWIWNGARDRHGYGRFIHERDSLAHRVAYVLLVGPIPDGLTLDHLCRRPLCVNPEHLEAVTLSENIRRGNPGAHYRDRTHCANGHEFTSPDTRIDALGARRCRECARLRNIARRRALRAKAGIE